MGQIMVGDITFGMFVYAMLALMLVPKPYGYRLAAFYGLWCLFTPLQEFVLDTAEMFIGFALCEVLYISLLKIFIRR